MSDHEWTSDQYQQHLRDTGQVIDAVIPKVVPKVVHKYGAVPTEVDGIRFASKAEAKHYILLKHRQNAGEISDLVLQPRFPLTVNGVKCGFYVADMQYLEDGKTIVCDVKGVPTPVYRLKKKLMKAIYGIEIMEVAA